MTEKDLIFARTRYGTTHPERVESELWETAVQNHWSSYDLRQHLAIRGSLRCQDFSHSNYRDSDPGPFWSWERFGRTSTSLPDGRVIHIAGEHEDSYDPDFCIYNDVVVDYPDGRRELYLYPKDVFPPTDFHSATLVGDEIILIGSLGYHDLRRPGETQVLKLDTRTLRMKAVTTRGEGPGWISRHTVEKLGEAAILVVGGGVQRAEDYEPNNGIFELDLATMTWRRRDHGDTAVFPVSPETYRTSKSPRYGVANPERSDNPFWLEMVRRQWPPSRARLHFGEEAPPEARAAPFREEAPDFGTPEFDAWFGRLSADMRCNKLARTIDDVIWTAVRTGALKMDLPDGRALLIGGEVLDYGDEYADPWVYNDVIATHPDGAVDILIYPREVFPQFLGSIVGTIHGEGVYIFGIVDWDRHPERPRGMAVLRLNTRSYEIAELQVPTPPARVNIYQGGETRAGNRMLFPIVRQRDEEPELGIALDLDTLSWSAPFAYAHRAGD